MRKWYNEFTITETTLKLIYLYTRLKLYNSILSLSTKTLFTQFHNIPSHIHPFPIQHRILLIKPNPLIISPLYQVTYPPPRQPLSPRPRLSLSLSTYPHAHLKRERKTRRCFPSSRSRHADIQILHAIKPRANEREALKAIEYI